MNEIFCQWLQALYSKSVSIVKTNGTLSRRFTIQRGTRQGDPLSPLLFAMYIEVLAIAIRQKQIIGKEIHKLELYLVKYLGIYIGKNVDELYKNHYCSLERKIRQDLNRWKLIPDGIYSIVETVKMMVLPQIIFLFQALQLRLPETYFYTWNKMISNFIWNNRKHRDKFKLLTQQKEGGGLGAPNIQNYYYATQTLTIMRWMKCDTEVKWINIEKERRAGVGLLIAPQLCRHVLEFTPVNE
uniref:Reverse transcriptase domain-containing protein n=1 Tax=Esox lucius TaxID=8010 RepID=A0A3P8YTS7_ESOLU